MLFLYNHGAVVVIADPALMPFAWETTTVLCHTKLKFTSTDKFSTSSSGGRRKSPNVVSTATQ